MYKMLFLLNLQHLHYQILQIYWSLEITKRPVGKPTTLASNALSIVYDMFVNAVLLHIV